jgi:hypothetical protein
VQLADLDETFHCGTLYPKSGKAVSHHTHTAAVNHILLRKQINNLTQRS